MRRYGKISCGPGFFEIHRSYVSLSFPVTNIQILKLSFLPIAANSRHSQTRRLMFLSPGSWHLAKSSCDSVCLEVRATITTSDSCSKFTMLLSAAGCKLSANAVIGSGWSATTGGRMTWGIGMILGDGIVFECVLATTSGDTGVALVIWSVGTIFVARETLGRVAEYRGASV